LLQLAIEKLSAAGYRYIGMDHFAVPDDDLARAQERGELHRNFMGYTTHAESDLVGLGVSAISHIGDSFSQNPRDLPSWEMAIDAGRLPVWRGLQLSGDDVLRADLIQALMCQGEVRIGAFEDRHDIDFHEYFAEDAGAAGAVAGRRPGRSRCRAHRRHLARTAAAAYHCNVFRPLPPAHHHPDHAAAFFARHLSPAHSGTRIACTVRHRDARRRLDDDVAPGRRFPALPRFAHV
jgi:oxygen-independent coproporphyrinogen-3 oxidase